VIYLYAISDKLNRPMIEARGLGNAPLSVLVHRQVAAIVSTVSEADVTPTVLHLWQHESVVETLMADRAVLPVRFGTVLGDTGRVRTTLARHHTNLVRALDLVRGRVELRVTVLWEGGEETGEGHGLAEAQGRGRAYLLSRLKERQRAKTLAGEIHAALAPLAVASVQQLLVTPRMLFSAAYLVERNEVLAFRDGVTNLAAAYPDLEVLCTGPWPAHNFVSTNMNDEEGEGTWSPQ